MPIIRVMGFNPHTTPGELLLFQRRLQDVVLSIPPLGLQDLGQVSVVFVAELLPPLGTDVIVVVEGLFATPARTPDVRQRLAEDIATVFDTFGKYAPHSIEVTVLSPVQPTDGYYKKQLK